MMFNMTFTIQQLAKISHVSTRTLRYYEEVGLIRPQRLDNNYRLYDLSVLDRIEMICTLKQSGLTLQQIRETLETPDELDGTLAQQKEVLKQRIKELKQSIDFIDRQMKISALYKQYGTNRLLVLEKETAQMEIVQEVKKGTLIVMEYEEIKVAADANDHLRKYIVRKTNQYHLKTIAVCFYDMFKLKSMDIYFEEFKKLLEDKGYQIASLIYSESYVLINEGIECLWAEIKR